MNTTVQKNNPCLSKTGSFTPENAAKICVNRAFNRRFSTGPLVLWTNLLNSRKNFHMNLDRGEPKIELRPVTKENWLECANLKLAPGQEKFVAQNVYSIAQAKFEHERVALAAYNENDQLVGFVMYNDKPLSDGAFRISRLIIDQEHQGKGYGPKVIKEVIRRLSAIEACHEVIVGISPGNEIVENAARKFGFTIFDESGSEKKAKLRLK